MRGESIRVPNNVELNPIRYIRKYFNKREKDIGKYLEEIKEYTFGISCDVYYIIFPGFSRQ